MKILTILGSPKKNGKTAEVLSGFEKLMAARGNDVERVSLTDYRVNGCIGCYACMSGKLEGYCVQKDDGNAILGKIAEADAVVYASPIYCFDISSQMKALIDRHFSLLSTSVPNGKKTALVLTCAGPEEGNTDLACEVFRRCFDGATGGMAKTDMVGRYVVPKSNDPDFGARAQTAAEKMAADLS